MSSGSPPAPSTNARTTLPPNVKSGPVVYTMDARIRPPSGSQRGVSIRMWPSIDEWVSWWRPDPSGLRPERRHVQRRRHTRMWSATVRIVACPARCSRPSSSSRAPRRRGPACAPDRALDHGAESKLTLISAPAGFGKSTLLADWLASGGEPGRSVAWLSLDSGDDDPMSFWTYVITGLQTGSPGDRRHDAPAARRATDADRAGPDLAVERAGCGAERHRAGARRRPRRRRPRRSRRGWRSCSTTCHRRSTW